MRGTRIPGERPACLCVNCCTNLQWKAGSCPDLVRTADYNQSCLFGCCNGSLGYHCLFLFFMNSLIKLANLPTSVNATQTAYYNLQSHSAHFAPTWSFTTSQLQKWWTLGHGQSQAAQGICWTASVYLLDLPKDIWICLKIRTKLQDPTWPRRKNIVLILGLRDVHINNINPRAQKIF